MKTFLVFCIFLLVFGCVRTVGDIRDNTFYYEDNYSVELPGDEWQIIRQQVKPGDPLFPSINPPRYSSSYQISFDHKKSGGFIGVTASKLTDIGKQRSLDVIADVIFSQSEGVKLSQNKVTVDGIEAIEDVHSGKKLVKLIVFKTDDMLYYVGYANTPTYFDQYLPVFDKFVSSMKVLKR
jgi:hypothetical protein